jgi:hypothetical protein
MPVSGYRADLDAITAARGVLRETVDALTAAWEGLDAGVGASIGPARLGAAAVSLTHDARAELDRVRRIMVEDAELVDGAARHYAEADRAAAEQLSRRAGEPG